MSSGTAVSVSDGRRHNFFIVDNEIVEHFGSKLGPYGVSVYCYLAFRARNGSCRVLTTTIARELGMGERSVREQLCRLDEEFHLISRKRTFGGASTYVLNPVKPLAPKRQDMPDCSDRQEMPERPAPDAAQSGSRCLQNKTTKTTTDTKSALGEKSPQPPTGDSRFRSIQACIRQGYERTNGVACPWDGGEAKNLTLFLASVPDWTQAQLETCVKNRFLSANPSDRPRKWLPSLADYLAGPKVWTRRDGVSATTRHSGFDALDYEAGIPSDLVDARTAEVH